MIADGLKEFAQNTRRTWKHDRQKTIGASEVGQCARAVWYDKNNTPPDPSYVPAWGFMLRGSVCEETYFAPAMKAKYGKRFRYGGEAQKTFIDPPLSATPDGLLRDVTPEECRDWSIEPTDCVLTEFKNIGSYKLSEAPKPNHEYQVQVQMGLVRAAGRYSPTAAILVYVSAFDWSNIREFAIPFNPNVFEYAKHRAAWILAAPSAAAVTPEGRLSGGNECRYCAFKATCDATETVRHPELSALMAERAAA